MTLEQAAWYLAAMIDGEGCVHFNLARRKWCVQVTNSDTDILDAVEMAMDVLGLGRSQRINIRDGRDRRRPCWSIRLIGGREAYRRLLQIVPIQCKRKRIALEGIVAVYKDMPERPTAAWLREHYVVKRWDMVEIARHWGRTASTIRYHMDRAGIYRRGKVEAGRMWAARKKSRTTKPLLDAA
jgi:hypothetical protein